MNQKEDLERLEGVLDFSKALRNRLIFREQQNRIYFSDWGECSPEESNKLFQEIVTQYGYREKEKTVSHLNYKWIDSVSSALNQEAGWMAFEGKISRDPIVPVLKDFLGFSVPTEGKFSRFRGWKHVKNDLSEDYYYSISPKLPNLFLLRVFSPYGNYNLFSQELVYSPNEYQLRKSLEQID